MNLREAGVASRGRVPLPRDSTPASTCFAPSIPCRTAASISILGVMRNVPEGGIELVPVRIAHETAEVGLAVVGARPWSTLIAAAGGECCVVEGLHGFARGRNETDVGAVSQRGRFAVGSLLYPELGKRLAVGNATGVFHDPLAA